MNKTCKIAVATLVAFSTLSAAEPDYSAWNALLAKHVRSGSKQGIAAHLVSYSAIAKDALYATALGVITSFDINKLQNRREKMAFYINAYNIAAIKKVLEKYPTKSIRAAGDGVWKEPAVTLGGKSVSLDEIENSILRKMGDARIHFAIVCASLSCPDLRKEAYTAARLETQLEAQTRAFIANPSKGLRVEGDHIHQSSIFVWFASDFKDLAAFQKKYFKQLPANAKRLEIPYNWQLNE